MVKLKRYPWISGGLFGTPQSTAPTGFGATGFGQQAQTTAFGSSGSAFKPAGGGFGTTQTGGAFGATPAAGGMFGANTSQANTTFGATTGGFGSSTTATGFGSTPSTNTFGNATAGFGQQQQQVNGTTVKFQPVTGSDTMMKSGVQQNISTRHQVRLLLWNISLNKVVKQ